ncbi:hypothetical protein FRB95_000367 [Tulasnella sp. JGI-2019a]|nr:hypothetical protein FRB95_000367 [Tulasnella sp. JGI-2019a]
MPTTDTLQNAVPNLNLASLPGTGDRVEALAEEEGLLEALSNSRQLVSTTAPLSRTDEATDHEP